MLTGEDIGKKTIVYDPNKKKWDNYGYCLVAIDTSLGHGYLDKEGKKPWHWPLKFIRVLDGY